MEKAFQMEMKLFTPASKNGRGEGNHYINYSDHKKSGRKKSSVLPYYFLFFSSFSEIILFLFACFQKYMHLCSAV